LIKRVCQQKFLSDEPDASEKIGESSTNEQIINLFD
jgi:hypothetical protein